MQKKAQLASGRRISEQDLEDIYELTYKYQMLRQEESLGDYGIPTQLPDRAYIAKEKIKDRLNYLLNENYEIVVDVYNNWIGAHEPWNDDTFYQSVFEWWEQVKDYDKDIDLLKRIVRDEEDLKSDLLEILEDHEVFYPGDEEQGSPEDLDPYTEKIKYLDTIKSKRAQQDKFTFMETLPFTEKPKEADLADLSFDELINLPIIDDDILVELFNKIEGTSSWDAWLEEMVEQEKQTYYEETALAKVVEVKDEVENNWGEDIGENIRLFQVALTTAHNNGEMAEYLIDSKYPVNFLHELSSGPHVEEWNRDLSKLLGYELGSRITPKQEWFQSAMKKLSNVIRLLKEGMNKKATIMKCKEKDKEAGKPWCLYTKDKSRLLGRHPTRESAEKQMRLVEMKKHGYSKRLKKVAAYLECFNG